MTSDLDLPVCSLDRVAYKRAVELLEQRGIIENGRLSRYGKQSRHCRWTGHGLSCSSTGADDLGSLPGGDELDRVAAPNDARGARSVRGHCAGQRSSHRVQSLRRGVIEVRVRGRGVRVTRRHLFAEADRAVGRSAVASWMKAIEDAALEWRACSAAWAWRCRTESGHRARSHLSKIHRAARAVHAVRSRHRRGNR